MEHEQPTPVEAMDKALNASGAFAATFVNKHLLISIAKLLIQKGIFTNEEFLNELESHKRNWLDDMSKIETDKSDLIEQNKDVYDRLYHLIENKFDKVNETIKDLE